MTQVKSIDGKSYLLADDVKDCIDTLMKILDVRSHPVYGRLAFPVGPKTRCEVSFTGPVSTDEYDALLAHMAYYKKVIVPPICEESPDTRAEIMKAFEKMLLGTGATSKEP